MNKILLSDRGYNRIKVLPLAKGMEIPESEADQIRWAEAKYERLRTDPSARRLCLYGGPRKGYLVSAWSLFGEHYLVQCIRIAPKVYSSTIYVADEPGDLVAIAKFLKENIETIMADYRDQLREASEALEPRTPAHEA